jgi:hypothetical protein
VKYGIQKFELQEGPGDDKTVNDAAQTSSTDKLLKVA